MLLSLIFYALAKSSDKMKSFIIRILGSNMNMMENIYKNTKRKTGKIRRINGNVDEF